MEYVGTYGGIVRENRDPLKLGRLKAHVPAVMGVASKGTEHLQVSELPWAMPAGLPAGGSSDSGGIDWLPEIGGQVWCRFLDGEPEKPIWEWAMQTIKQAEGFKLHDYDPLTGRPARAGFTRHGHAIDISQDAIIVTARGGYAVELQAGVVPGKGLAKLRTPAGLTITLNDETGVLEITTATGQMLQLDDLNQSLKALIGRDIDLDVGDELSLTASRV